MSNFNFFEWMRNGVKSAVLLGVSDAVEEIGMPTETDGSENNMLSFMQNAKSQQAISKSSGSSGSSRSGSRKRLGRSLKDIEPNSK
ncbi:hypothetical protein [Blastopirellula marina]|uniref:Uncharacterized protein n=1 Tax=Blastopirellula marina TaxID=124 RepID=A0A2S8GJ84_9BACT|nr:hypothetical protein [Blastopirellula marina]PQO44486.1 hypothetical protein C5Y93_18930 [Blastopirellula marina]